MNSNSERRFSYPDDLHEDVVHPLVPPPGWGELAVLVSERLEERFKQGELAAASGYASAALSRAERGLMNRVPPKLIAAYRDGLARLRSARAARRQGT